MKGRGRPRLRSVEQTAPPRLVILWPNTGLAGKTGTGLGVGPEVRRGRRRYPQAGRRCGRGTLGGRAAVGLSGGKSLRCFHGRWRCDRSRWPGSQASQRGRRWGRGGLAGLPGCVFNRGSAWRRGEGGPGGSAFFGVDRQHLQLGDLFLAGLAQGADQFRTGGEERVFLRIDAHHRERELMKQVRARLDFQVALR
jgi:hypothetical protein